MLYLTCTTITSIDLAHYGVSRARDWVSVKCGTRHCNSYKAKANSKRYLICWIKGETYALPCYFHISISVCLRMVELESRVREKNADL